MAPCQHRRRGTGPTGPYQLGGVEDEFGFTGDLNAPGSAGNQDHTALLLTTSSFPPPDEFPQFASQAPVDWAIPGGPFDPHLGEWYVYSQQADVSYKRLTQTVDLTGATSGALTFWTFYDTEKDWDYLFVEAHEVGSDVWTTLPDTNGHTDQSTGQSCPAGWVEQLHPFLAHYIEMLAPTGTTTRRHRRLPRRRLRPGRRRAGDRDLVRGRPRRLDRRRVARGLGREHQRLVRTQLGFEEGAVTTTEDTVFAGFGFEGLAQTQRDDLVARAMAHLLP